MNKHNIDTCYNHDAPIVFIKKKPPTTTTITYDVNSRSIIVRIIEKCPRCTKTINKIYIRNIYDLGIA